jgi:serine/threonine protein kinase
MEGGRFLGSGTYGCAFTPPLLCEKDTKKRFGKVGKITMEPLAQQEVLIASRIRKVPLASHYFLLPEPESCTPAPEKVQTEPGLEVCRDDFASHGEELDIGSMKQIVEPFGGITPLYQLYSKQSLHPKHFNYYYFMRHMLEAGSTLLLAGVCHFDLHPGNLLFDKNKTVRILDFGLSFPTNNINETVVNGRWKRLRFGFESDAAHPTVHNSEAPELTIMNATRRREYSVKDAVKMTVLGKPIFKDMEKYLSISREVSRDSLTDFFESSKYARDRNFIALWRTYWPGFDAWAIGCILVDVLAILLLLPEFTEGQYKTRKSSVLATLKGLLEPDPRKRLDCIEALALFDPGSPWISRFGYKWLAARKQQRQQKLK